MLKKCLFYSMALLVLWSCQTAQVENSKTIEKLQQLLAENPESIVDLTSEISKEESELVSELIIRLNDEMLDLNKKVNVIVNGRSVFNDVPKRSASTIWKSLNERNDLEQLYCAEINVSLV